MTLPERIQSLLSQAFAALHPCLYGPMGGGDAADLDALYAALERDVALLMPGTDAHAVIAAFRARIPEVRRLLETDISAAYEGDPAATCRMEVVMAYPGLYAVTVYRLAHELYKLKVPIIPRIMSEYAHSKTGIDIHPGATIGEHFFIDHGTGIVIGETSEIGEHAKIYQGVTLGALSTRGGQRLKGRKRHPTIEDDVTIYSGASILGGETVISEGAVIGGNAFVTKSVPEQTRVSAKMPELQFKRHENVEFQSGEFLNYEI